MNNQTSRLPRPAVALVVTAGISQLGSAMTTFGLNVWIFRETGSYAVFAYLALLATLPSLLFAPVAGVIVDRMNRRRVLLACDLGSMLVVLIALALLQTGSLSIPVLASLILVLSVAAELRWSAMGAMIPMIVTSEHLQRVNGLQQSLRGIVVMGGPVLGALGFDALGLKSLLGFDVLSYLIAIGGWLAIGSIQHVGGSAPKFSGFWHELTFGFRWVFAQPGLRRLLLFFMVVNIGVSVFTVTLTPYVLSFASNKTLGVSLGLLGAGSVLSGLLLVQLRGKSRHDRNILWGSFGFGCAMFLWGGSRDVATLWTVAFLFGVLECLILSSSHTIWQTHVPSQIQGKVFAVRTVCSFGLMPLSIFCSVPLATQVFAPLLSASPALQAIWGAELSGALGLTVSMLGTVVCLSALVMIGIGGLRLPASRAVLSTAQG